MSHLRGSSTGARQAAASRATDGYRKQARACRLLAETVVGWREGREQGCKAQMDHAHRPSRSLQPLHPGGIEIQMSAWQRCCKTLPERSRAIVVVEPPRNNCAKLAAGGEPGWCQRTEQGDGLLQIEGSAAGNEGPR